MSRLSSIAISIGLGISGGALAGFVCGEIIYQRALERVQTAPHSIQGDVGGYLCAAGDAPIGLAFWSAIIGAVINCIVMLGWSLRYRQVR
jgi:hypothetical protein